jgi:hypothetical protein
VPISKRQGALQFPPNGRPNEDAGAEVLGPQSCTGIAVEQVLHCTIIMTSTKAQKSTKMIAMTISPQNGKQVDKLKWLIVCVISMRVFYWQMTFTMCRHENLQMNMIQTEH